MSRLPRTKKTIEYAKVWNKITIEQFPEFVRFVAVAFMLTHLVYLFLMNWAGMEWFAFMNVFSILAYLEIIRFSMKPETFWRVYLYFLIETIPFVSIMAWAVEPYLNVVWLMLPLLPFTVLMKYYFISAELKGRISYKITTGIILVTFAIDVLPKYLPTKKLFVIQSDYIYNVISMTLLVEIFLSVAILCAGMTIILTNTQKKEREMMLRAQELKDIAETASQAKTEFLSSMSHEIRTPLNGVLGMNEMILATTQEESTREYAQVIDSSGQMLLSLINDILDISRVEAGRMEIIENKYLLSELVKESYATIVKKAAEKELNTSVSIDPNLPDFIWGDSLHIKQILVNLLSNAVKYTEAGDVSFSVEGKVRDSLVRLHFKVSDTGIGLTEENIENIFNKFERFDIEKNRNIEGTGLGMSIVKNLADLLGADLRISSVYGVGSSFELVIEQKILNDAKVGDLKLESSKPDPIPENSIPKANNNNDDNITHHKPVSRDNREGIEPRENRGRRIRILAVDDMPVNLAVFSAMLKNVDVYVETATGGVEALDKMKFKDYDIIFMDHMMPDLDGVETTRRMKAEPNIYGENVNAPIIMLTANAISGMREKYLEWGFTDYISKPIKADDLKQMINKYCSKKS